VLGDYSLKFPGYPAIDRGERARARRQESDTDTNSRISQIPRAETIFSPTQATSSADRSFPTDLGNSRVRETAEEFLAEPPDMQPLALHPPRPEHRDPPGTTAEKQGGRYRQDQEPER